MKAIQGYAHGKGSVRWICRNRRACI